ncbi:MAG: REP-associated tyrosine transposase [Candidatus Angelobacter sp.]
MPKGLHRWYGGGEFHFITCSCHRRQPFLSSARRKDLFLKTLEETRKKYGFAVAGYVVMPEHVHLLLGEPRAGTPSVVMQVLKQRVARKCRERSKSKAQAALFDGGPPPSFWQVRFYDFNVFSRKKYVEKLRYMHRNPVKRGLVQSPELWRWSSYRFYSLGEGPVRIE